MKTSWIRSSLWLALVLMIVGCFPPRRLDLLRGGLTYGWSNFPRFETMVGSQPGILDYNSVASVVSYGLFLEGLRNNWVYGAGLTYGQHEFSQTFTPGAGRPDRTEGLVNGYFVDTWVGRRIPITPRFEATLLTGPVLAHNRANFKWTAGNELRTEDRTHNGFTWRFGGAVDFSLVTGWGINAGIDYVNMGREDANSYSRAYAGLRRDFWGGRLEHRVPVGSARRGGGR